jgi:hypothetical protein
MRQITNPHLTNPSPYQRLAVNVFSTTTATLPVGVNEPLAVSFMLRTCRRSCLPFVVNLILTFTAPTLAAFAEPVATSIGRAEERWAPFGTSYHEITTLPAAGALNENV